MDITPSVPAAMSHDHVLERGLEEVHRLELDLRGRLVYAVEVREVVDAGELSVML